MFLTTWSPLTKGLFPPKTKLTVVHICLDYSCILPLQGVMRKDINNYIDGVGKSWNINLALLSQLL